MYGLDLFSGIGGITKALEGYVDPIAYCENDRYAQGVLLSRMASGDLPLAPIWDDITTLQAEVVPPVDIIYGGFPCQDISVAGRGAGLGGERSGLFFEIMRLADEIRPRFIFLENVTRISVLGLERVLAELRMRGYDARGLSLCASEVGSKMHGHRWFCLAKAASPGLERLEQHQPPRKAFSVPPNYVLQTISEEDVRCHPREVDGVQIPVDRIRALGNAVVPAQAREAFERLMGL